MNKNIYLEEIEHFRRIASNVEEWWKFILSSPLRREAWENAHFKGKLDLKVWQYFCSESYYNPISENNKDVIGFPDWTCFFFSGLRLQFIEKLFSDFKEDFYKFLPKEAELLNTFLLGIQKKAHAVFEDRDGGISIDPETFKIIENFENSLDLSFYDSGLTDDMLFSLSKMKQPLSMSLSNNPFGNRGLSYLSHLESLRELNLSHTLVDDDGLKYLSKLKNLKALFLENLSIQGIGFKGIEDFPILKTLNLRETAFTNEGLSFLPKCPKLHFLDLSETKITGPILHYLKASSELEILELNSVALDPKDLPFHLFKKLMYLEIADCGVEDEGISSLQHCPCIFRLDLHNNRITAKGLSYLKNLPNLMILTLSENNIGLEGVKILKEFPSLQSLGLSKTGLTEEVLPLLKEFPMLSSIDLSENDIPPEIAEQYVTDKLEIDTD